MSENELKVDADKKRLWFKGKTVVLVVFIAVAGIVLISRGSCRITFEKTDAPYANQAARSVPAARGQTTASAGQTRRSQ